MAQAWLRLGLQSIETLSLEMQLGTGGGELGAWSCKGLGFRDLGLGFRV